MNKRSVGRLGTLRAMAALCWARLFIAFVPFRWWRGPSGSTRQANSAVRPSEALREGKRLARQVDRAAEKLPIKTSCLTRAMSLGWILRRKRIAHALVFAVRPLEMRGSADALHAWIEVGGKRVIGDLPGPWIETWRREA
jgi:hypothetical protein